MPDSGAPIKCPFLNMTSPDTSSRRRFSRDCRREGMGRWVAPVAVFAVALLQRGPRSVLLRGETPDLYALDEVPGVSHLDLYAKYQVEVRAQADECQEEAKITMQDLVNMKRWVADQEEVKVKFGSRVDTSLLFVGAGGDLESGKVSTDDVFRLLSGQAPTHRAKITVPAVFRAHRLANWSQ